MWCSCEEEEEGGGGGEEEEEEEEGEGEEEEETTTDRLIFQCKKLRIQRNEVIKQIKDTGGNWPTTYEKLVNNHLQIFVKFVKFIDFTDLQ